MTLKQNGRHDCTHVPRNLRLEVEAVLGCVGYGNWEQTPDPAKTHMGRETSNQTCKSQWLLVPFFFSPPSNDQLSGSSLSYNILELSRLLKHKILKVCNWRVQAQRRYKQTGGLYYFLVELIQSSNKTTPVEYSSPPVQLPAK